MNWQRATPNRHGIIPTKILSHHRLTPPSEMIHYQPAGGWHWYAQRIDIRDEGWKLHFSGDAANAAALYAALLAPLRLRNIAHKFLPTLDEVNRQVGQQAGKILAVYPDDIAQAFQIVRDADQILQPLGWNRQSSPLIANERPVGGTVAYTRYGPYNNVILDPNTGEYVDDSIGQIMPAWIQDPWPHYPNAAAVAGFAPWPTHDRRARRRGPRK